MRALRRAPSTRTRDRSNRLLLVRELQCFACVLSAAASRASPCFPAAAVLRQRPSGEKDRCPQARLRSARGAASGAEGDCAAWDYRHPDERQDPFVVLTKVRIHFDFEHGSRIESGMAT